MIRMIHRTTGVEMWVDENSVKDFVRRGHIIAPVPVKKPMRPQKTSARKTTKK